MTLTECIQRAKQYFELSREFKDRDPWLSERFFEKGQELMKRTHIRGLK